MALVFVLLIVVSELIASSGRTAINDVAHEILSRSQISDMQQMAAGVNTYIGEFGQIPASLAALTGTPGYETLRSRIRSRMGFSVVSDINDGRYRFDRAVLYMTDIFDQTSEASYLANNQCGAGASSTYWCGDEQSFYFVGEERHIYDSVRSEVLIDLEGTFFKLLTRVGFGGAPKTLSSGVELNDGESISLASAVGFVGTAGSCSGTFSFDGVALDCRDLFDVYGNVVMYTYFTGTSIAVGTTLPIALGDGSQMTLVKVGEV